MKYKMMFYAPPDDVGGGEAAPVSEPALPTKGLEVFGPAKQGVGDRPLPGEKLDATIASHDPQQTVDRGVVGDGTRTPIPFDQSKFAKELGKSVVEAVKPTAAQPPLSPEEAKRLLNVWEPDDAWYAEYDNLETRKSAVSKMRDGLIRQSDTIAQLRMHELIDSLRNEIMPHLGSVKEFVQNQREERFHRTYPQLAKPELRPLVVAVASDLLSKGSKYDNEADMFKALGAGVEAVIKATNPDFKLTGTGASAPVLQPGRSTNAIPSTSPGAGGGGGGPNRTAAKPRGLAIFDR